MKTTLVVNYKADKKISKSSVIVREAPALFEDNEYLKKWLRELDEEDFTFFSKHLGLLNHPDTLFAATNSHFYLRNNHHTDHSNVININKINSNRWVNKFFESVNHKLPVDGLYIGCVELYTNRKKRILAKYPAPFNRIYYFFDVLLKRVVPKLPMFVKIYFTITLGKNRALSKAETFGRLYSCGFDVIDEKFIKNNLFFVAKKVREPYYDSNPTYGPLITLKRYGKNGKLIKVHKLRTMYPFSEYLQDYIYRHNSLMEGGKFKNDFRVTTEGKFFRKFWLDEIPMLLNVLKGEIKIVGVRPLSGHYFSLYSEELKQKRVKFKPGLIPPYYVDLPKTLEEIMASEMRYLASYEKHPFRTDVSYFVKAMYNILFRGARSN